MNKEDLITKWIQENMKVSESYLQYKEPWKQSGFSGPLERWISCRKPIADCIDHSGAFLDIGCANGYLIECILKWKAEEGICLKPYGVDINIDLLKLARKRLPEYPRNLFLANAWNWKPPLRLDFVRTELVYVPKELRKVYVDILLYDYLKEDGKLLVCEYRSRNHTANEPWVDEVLNNMGFNISIIRSGVYEDKELTRVAVIAQ
jgi:SAM-dependent methyltransferase